MFIIEGKEWSFEKRNHKNAALVLLKDQRVARIRPMNGADVDRVYETHTRLSADSLYYRYFHPYKPTVEDMQRIYSAGQNGGAAFVATLLGYEDRVIGVAHYGVERNNPGEAELAVIVEDQYQGQGLGRALLERLTQYARAHGIQTLRAVVNPTNARMMHLVETGGLPYRKKFSDGMWDVSVEI